jgi:uncharacterized UPF0160 family protein
MGYQLTNSTYSYNQGEVLQELKLIDIEQMKSILVEKNLDTGEAKVHITTWGKDRYSEKPVDIFDTKNLPLKSILEKAGINKTELAQTPPEATIISHTPPFHADDLMACALMAKYFESKATPFNIVLTRDQTIIDQAEAVVDVGSIHAPENLRFDHHQLKESKRAATGLVTEFLKNSKEFKWLNLLEPTIDKIDKADLGKPDRPQDLRISEALASFNATWREKQNNQFFIALSVLQEALEKTLETLETTESLKSVNCHYSKDLNANFEDNLLKHPLVKARHKEVEEAKIEGNAKFILSALKGEKSGIANTQKGIDFSLLFSQEYLSYAPQNESKALKAINFICFETDTGAYNAIAAPKPENKMEQKHPFPKEWRGKRGQDLVDAISKSTGENFPPVPTEKTNEFFCHNAGFFFTSPNKRIFDRAISYCANLAKPRYKETEAPIFD